MKSKFIFFFLLLASCLNGFAQDTSDDENTGDNDGQKAFQMGLYVGSYFANKYTAHVYDGYGFDFNGNKNNFDNSFMNEKINIQYGGGSGQPDQIALALNVDPNDWWFTEDDMPINMKYNSAFVMGFNSRYCLNRKNSILLNVNVSRLTISGNFTIETRLPAGSSQLNESFETFGIKGGEQRLIFQAGYQRILGDDARLNLLVEGGLDVTVTKFDKNQIQIKEILIDLATYYDQQYGNIYNIKKPVGAGFGLFAGFGINLTMSEKWVAQLIYSPAFDKINIGVNPKFTLQHAGGLRAYYIL